MTARIFLKLIAVVICLTGVALVSADFLASHVAERYFVAHLQRELEQKGRILIASHELDQTHIASLGRAAGVRLTVVTREGTVLADSAADPSLMESHKDRPEIQQAFQGRVGRDTRPSRTLGASYLYLALPFNATGHNPVGAALRLAVPLSVVNAEVAAIRRGILYSVALAFLPAVLIAAFLSRRLATRLSDLIAYAGELANANFQARLKSRGGGELGLLALKLNETGAKLEGTVQQLQHEHAELDRLERVRTDFVINVSHELRTPLASIQGYTETLLDGAIHDEDNNIRFLTIIRHNAERLSRLTADLLTLSRLELKTQEFRWASFRANELLGDVVDTVRPIAQKKSIVMKQELAPSDCEIFCDSEAFYQIVSNLLDNAVKYTPEHGMITVGANPVRRADGSEWVEFMVRDTGMGIPAQEQTRLFERFYRVDKARSRDLGGTGLGLAIVKHLVKAHGGDVRVESDFGHGSSFFFTLPVDPPPDPRVDPHSADLHGDLTAS